jgi:hypothetical protein
MSPPDDPQPRRPFRPAENSLRIGCAHLPLQRLLAFLGALSAGDPLHGRDVAHLRSAAAALAVEGGDPVRVKLFAGR